MDRTRLALAGLLHDIGKFWQRAERRGVADRYQGFDKNDYGAHGAHATWSAAFVDTYVPQSLRNFGYAVLYHHNPQDHLTKIVALADRLASGEREKQDEKQPRSLLSIFCQLGEDENNLPRRVYLPLKPLELSDDTLFPGPEASDTVTSDAYASLWKQFTGDAQAIQVEDDPAAYLESMYHLLYRYTWCVPSAFYRSTPDISLFDHSRVTAALAACLAELDEATVDHLLMHPDDNNKPVAYLLEGDVSGVQRFIYTITSKGAAKGLRGRSFYLQLFTEAVARFILRWMQLPITNLIYVGGGHFYLLVPPGEIDKLEDIQRHLDDVLLAHHEGALYVALGRAELRATDFQVGSFGKKWGEVGRDVGRAKRRRFAEVGDLFEPQGHGGNKETECQVCHAERDDVQTDERTDDERTDEEKTRKCPLCLSFEELGQRLGHSDLLVLGEIEPQQRERGTWQDVLAELGVAVGLYGSGYHDGWGLKPGGKLNHATVLGLRAFPDRRDVTRIMDDLRCPVSVGVRFTANVTPRKGREVATFKDMQEAARGLKQLGVLRMDVDDLGYLFAQGFQRKGGSGTSTAKGKPGKQEDQPANLSTLARTASLSAMLALYFEGWVGELCQRINDENEVGLVYTIYSGGDDLFIVGAWHVLPGLAADIQQDLARFAAGNPLVHASAGITLHGGKYPLYQAAEDAADALNQSKDVDGKNAITFLGQAVSWTEWQGVVHQCGELVELVGKSGVGRSLLHILQNLHASYRDLKKNLAQDGQQRTRNGQLRVVWGPYMWRGTYLLTRLAGRVGNSAGQRVQALRDDLSRKQFEQIELVGLAARWAEALTRREREKANGA